MIDLHNHILPGIDDGAADLDESIRIANQFVSEGVFQVAATPHLNPSRGTVLTQAEVQHKVDELQTALDEAQVRLEVLPGQEIYLTPEAPALAQAGKVAPLGASKTLLIEIPFDLRPLYLEDTIFRLEVAGYGVVLAHPERYVYIQRDVSAIDDLVEKGVILQLTAPSLLGEYGSVPRRTGERILRRGGYALASSDRHHPGPARSLAVLDEKLRDMVSSDIADLLLRENPSRLLTGQTLIQPDPFAQEKGSFFARLFKRSS